MILGEAGRRGVSRVAPWQEEGHSPVFVPNTPSVAGNEPSLPGDGEDVFVPAPNHSNRVQPAFIGSAIPTLVYGAALLLLIGSVAILIESHPRCDPETGDWRDSWYCRNVDRPLW